MDFIMQCISLFQKGGPVMYAIVLCSFIAVAIGAERFYYYKEGSNNTRMFIDKLQELLERQRGTEALEFCENTTGILGAIAAKGLKAHQRESPVEIAMEGAASLSAARLREHLNYLSGIVTLSPLLGLLGTVVGMISSFSVLQMKSGQPMAITGGVGEALVATAAGLSVAILAFVLHAYLAQRVDQMITDMEEVCTLVLTHLPKRKQARRENHEIA
jgi:biopolymer transport protein ExbB